MKLRLAASVSALAVIFPGPGAFTRAAETVPPKTSLVNTPLVFSNVPPHAPSAGSEALSAFPAQPVDPAKFWAIYGDLLKAVKGAKTLTVFKGVARQRLVKGEPSPADQKTMFRSDGQWFHSEPYEVPAELAETLRATVFTGVKTYSGMKACGGFHADLRLKWEGSILADTEVQICFSCHELTMNGTAGSLHGDVLGDQLKQIQKLTALLWEKRDPRGSVELPPAPLPRF